MEKNNKDAMENAKRVADQMYDRSKYDSNDEADQGIAVTHEQVSDAYMEGTFDAKIDEVNEEGKLNSHKGQKIAREGFEK